MTTCKASAFYVYIMPVASVVVVVVLGALDPASNDAFPPCFLRTATGWLCPGCGSARAIHALVHGDVGTALRMNSLAVAALPAVGSDFFLHWSGDRAGWMSRLKPAWVWFIAGGIILFGVLRNLVT